MVPSPTGVLQPGYINATQELGAQRTARQTSIMSQHTHTHYLYSPLHDGQALFSPGEAASSSQAEGSGRCGDGRRSLPPLHLFHR